MIDRWLAIHGHPGLKALSAAQRVAAANSILLSEGQGGTSGPAPTPAPTRLFEVTDWGLQSEEWLRAKLAQQTQNDWSNADLDTFMVGFAISFGKVVTPLVPLDKNVPPFYLINGVRESIYELRLRIKALYVDEWNTMSRDDVLARLRANNDTVQPL